MTKTEKLRALLHGRGTECLLEAHNGVSARIVEESGGRGIWASGLALSVQYGVRDSNEASWTQVVDMLEFMSDVTTIPILLDGDTGYGNFNNMRRLVKKLEQRGVAGVCIEDKEFPKTNSFIAPHHQVLADCEEFCGKIRAGKDSQQDEQFCIVARTEALVTGQGLAEALRRAGLYHEAGADAILVHSRAPGAGEVLEFAREWAGRCPLVIIPTSYYSTPIEVFERAGITLVIWANQLIRSCISSMKKTAAEIVDARSVRGVEDCIASLQELFQLQGAAELASAESRYLAPSQRRSAIILAASRGTELHSLTGDRPKVMLSINGRTLLDQLLDALQQQGVSDITLVAGYRKETIPSHRGVRILHNREYASSNELHSLAVARSAFSDDMIISYGDLLLRSYILHELLENEQGEITVVVDSGSGQDGDNADYAWCDRADDRSLFHQDVQLQKLASQDTDQDTRPSGVWIGLMRVRGEGRNWLESTLEALQQRDDFTRQTLPDLLNHLLSCGHPVRVHYIHGHWLNVNTLEDVKRAGDFTARR